MKWRAVSRQLQKEPEPPEADQADVDLEGQQCDDQPLLENPVDAERKDFDDLNYEPIDNSGAEHMDDAVDSEVEPIDWESFPNFFDDGDDDSTMVDALLKAGVDSNLSKIYAATLTGKVSGTTLIEAYGRGSIMAEANLSRRNLNVHGLHALDLRTTKEDGTPWDFNQRSDRKLAFQLIERDCPDWVIGSPP